MSSTPKPIHYPLASEFQSTEFRSTSAVEHQEDAYNDPGFGIQELSPGTSPIIDIVADSLFTGLMAIAKHPGQPIMGSSGFGTSSHRPYLQCEFRLTVRTLIRGIRRLSKLCMVMHSISLRDYTCLERKIALWFAD
ncbi:hypothetical protein BU17DRAFT_102607 [Hysterangium stoloniferum]|nr:hypothetical protein BU17DRAFT_102607 [Hysterangium stoloniferum]